MILYDSGLVTVCQDYGIMLPISPARGEKILAFLSEKGALDREPLKPLLDIKAARRLLGEEQPALARADLERVHHQAFVAALYADGPEGEKNLEQALLNAWELVDKDGKPNRYEPSKSVKPLKDLFRLIMAQAEGTYLACRLALEHGGFCYYLGGGMHHARLDHGSGFCLINDLMIAAEKLRAEQRASLVWVIDLDAHKGCGTAELIAAGSRRTAVHLSIHMASGWPLDRETLQNALPNRAPLVPADVDIPIQHGEEGRYLEKLRRGLHLLEERSCGAAPDVALVVDGADPYEHDGLPSSALLTLTLDECAARDMEVFEYLQSRRIPSAWVIAGGYGERAYEPAARFLHSLSAAEAR
jgi:acetoin utilization deacetylase AcuC-like enzyme